MAVLEWNDRLNIGVELVDNAHKKLFSIMRRMVKLKENPKNYKLLCQEGIKFFKSYTLQHFSEEEEYMRSIGYSGYETHKRLHENMRDKTLPILEQDAADADYSIESVERFMGVILAWLTQHIMTEDRAITGKAAKKWTLDKPHCEINALGKAVSEILQDVLGLSAQIASECYSGEDIGNAIFYRLTYSTKENKKTFAYLGFEESLVLHATSEMLGSPVKKIGSMSLSATSELCQSIMKKIGEHFTYLEDFTFEKANLISYELLAKAFQWGYPPYSLLLRTNAGYFVLCIQP